MVAHLLRLRLTLLVGALRGDRPRAALTLVGTAVGLALLVIAVAALIGLGDRPEDIAAVVVTLGGAAVTLGFAVGPILLSTEDQLDPRRFAPFGLPLRPLASSLLLAGLVSPAALALVTLGVAATILWHAQGVAWVGGALAAACAVLTAMLATRLAAVFSARVLRHRRTRELSGILVVGVIAVVLPIGVFFASMEWGRTVPPQLEVAGHVLGDSPLGAAWAIPARFAAGDDRAWISVAVAVATLIVLYALWEWTVRRLLTSTDRPGWGRSRSGLGWFAVAPGTATGAIAARSLIYWLRDRRYLANIVIVPVAGLLVTLPMLVAGLPPALVALAPLPVIALFFGWLPHNDTAYDSTAIWMHVSSAVKGAADRIGRLVPVVLVAVPVLAVAVPIAVALHGRWAVLPAMIGLCLCLFLTGLGLSSIASAVSPYPASRPGDSPFQQPQSSGRSGVASQAGVLLGAIVLSSPVAWTAWTAVVDDPRHGTTALWTGLGIGVAVLAVGVALGGWLFRRRGARLMEFAETM